MDQDAYKKTYSEINQRFCPFEKSILANYCSCSQANRFCLAEREGIHCHSDGAQRLCQELMAKLRQHARFTLKVGNNSQPLPHGKAMRIQIGGLRGLYAAVSKRKPPPVITNIHNLVTQAIENFNDLDKLPFKEIIKEVAAFRGRQRKR